MTVSESVAELPYIADGPLCLLNDPCVYAMQFVLNGERGLIKIGWSKRPTERRYQVAKEAGVRAAWLETIASCPAPPETEFEIHAALDAWRVQGEWFEPEPEVLAVVGTMHHICWDL
jgi:hypothetical protein